MPAYIYNFIAGMGIGYYLLNQTFRALVNQVILGLFRLLHKSVIAVLTLALNRIKNRYTPKITALQPQRAESIKPTPQTAQKQGVATKDVILDGGKKTLWVSDEELAKWMANPDVKVSDKSEQE